MGELAFTGHVHKPLSHDALDFGCSLSMGRLTAQTDSQLIPDGVRIVVGERDSNLDHGSLRAVYE